MNDHEYRPYEPRIGDTYRQYATAIVDSFKARGGSLRAAPGTLHVLEVGKIKEGLRQLK